MLSLTSTKLKAISAEILILPVCEDKDVHSGKSPAALTAKARAFQEFKGKPGDTFIFYQPSGYRAVRVMLWGVGEASRLDGERLRQMAGESIRHAIRKGFAEVVLAAPSAAKLKLKTAEVLTAMLEGASLGNRLFDRYRSEKNDQPIKRIHLWVTPEAKNRCADLPARVEAICAGTRLARDWVDTPANDKTPARLAETIVSAAEAAELKASVVDEAQIAALGLRAMAAVARGSSHPPRLVTLEHNPRSAAEPILLVGKGVTFDSGGINLKPAASLEGMKSDMAGAAAVAATLVTLARLRCPKRVVGLLPLVENMPSGNALRPGDIVTTHAGKTVEVGNTDAEGRLILADALSYGIQVFKPSLVIDLATLTGACVVALGERIAGLFTPDDHLAAAIVAAGTHTHERCWRMPLPDDYKGLLKSELADLRNVGKNRSGGAILAALFLAEYVGRTRWAHIDIAGPAYAKKGSAYANPGGTGFGVRLLCRLMETL